MKWYERPRNWILIFIGIAVLSVGLTFLGLYLKRYVYTLERQAVKNSLQYREGKTSQLMQLAQEWNDAKEGQRKFLFQRIKIEAERIGVKNTPDIIQDILRSER